MKRVEVENRKYICQFCAKDFKNAGCLERHLNQYHQQGSFSCDQCSKCYKDEFRLTMHIKRKHAGPYKLQRDYLCVECGKCLTSKASLDNHIIRFHSDQNLSCQECSREFKHPYGASKRSVFVVLYFIYRPGASHRTGSHSQGEERSLYSV